LSLLLDLGFKINIQKSIFEPVQTITYLGVTWHGDSATLIPDYQKLDKIASLSTQLLQRSTISLRDSQRLGGMINFAAPLLKMGKHKMYQYLHHLSQTRCQSISKDLRETIDWWAKLPSNAFPESWRIPKTSRILWTDSSNEGWGAVTESGESFSMKWCDAMRREHITIKETLTILLALEKIQVAENSTVLIYSDCATSCSVVNKLGSIRSVQLNNIAIKMAALAEQRKCHLKARHIAGKTNVWADSLSHARPPIWGNGACRCHRSTD